MCADRILSVAWHQKELRKRNDEFVPYICLRDFQLQQQGKYNKNNR